MSDPGLLRIGEHEFTAADLLAILDGVGDAITVQEPGGRIIFANPAAARTSGYETPEAMLAADNDERLRRFHVMDESGAPLDRKLLPGVRSLTGGTDEERLVRYRVVATGEERWTMVKAQPVFDTAGKVRFVINIGHDVSEVMVRQRELESVTTELEVTIEELQSRTTEAEAAQERAEYTANRQSFLAEAGRLLAASLDPEETLRMIAHLAVPRIADWCTITLLDDDGKIRQLEVAHADPDKLRFAIELQKRYPPDDEGTRRVMRTGKSELYSEISDEMIVQGAREPEHLQMLRNLQLKSAMIVPLKFRGQSLGVITFVGAESGRRYGPDDLEFAESLAARSGLALSNARLYQEAQEANRTKADFLAVMSHELRTPLTAIFGYTELLATGVTGPVTNKQRDQLERIRGSAAHLLSIIEDILNYARAEAGHDEVRPETVNLSSIVSEAASLVRPEAAHKKLELLCDIKKDCAISTDRGKVRQILVNLIGNAVKFTEKGLIEVTAECTDGEAILTVRDTGVGIPEADLERIFEPFRQLQSATTRTTGGTGLGLAVTRRFATLLGGSIVVQSKVGEGTLFTVRIPLSTGERAG